MSNYPVHAGQIRTRRNLVAGEVTAHAPRDYGSSFQDRELGVRTVLAMRKMKNGGPYKPYAIIDEYAFSATEELLQKGTPL